MIRGGHTMFYSSQPVALRAFIRDKLGFPCTDVGDGSDEIHEVAYGKSVHLKMPGDFAVELYEPSYSKR
jgi:hypothetical protein